MFVGRCDYGYECDYTNDDCDYVATYYDTTSDDTTSEVTFSDATTSAGQISAKTAG